MAFLGFVCKEVGERWSGQKRAAAARDMGKRVYENRGNVD